jgi:ABC-type sugar transport system substrate-binding protein
VCSSDLVELIVVRPNWFNRYEMQLGLAKQFRVQPDFDFDGLIAPNDSALFGAIEALSTFSADPAKKVVVGFDGVPEAFQYMREGRLTATVAGFPDKMVDQALRLLVENLRTGKAPTQKLIVIEPELITRTTPAG